MWQDWAAAGLICAGFGVFEAIASGQDPAAALRSIRQPRLVAAFLAVGGHRYRLVSDLLRLRWRAAAFPARGRHALVLLLALMLANGAAGIVQLAA